MRNSKIQIAGLRAMGAAYLSRIALADRPAAIQCRRETWATEDIEKRKLTLPVETAEQIWH